MKRAAILVAVLLLAPVLLLLLLLGGKRDRALVSEHLETLTSGCTLWGMTLMVLYIIS